MLRNYAGPPSLSCFRLFSQLSASGAIHTSRVLHRKVGGELRVGSSSELVERICRILTLHRFNALSRLSFEFSDAILDSVLIRLRKKPDLCLRFFELASKQRHFKPALRSYCQIVHILAKGSVFDRARALLRELVGGFGSGGDVALVFDELGRVYKEFRFAPVVFDMLLKVCCELGQRQSALYVFDSMGKLGRQPSVRSCNSLLSDLVKHGESGVAVQVYDQIVRAGILPDVYMFTIMVNALCKEGAVEKALKLMEEMENKGFEPNIVT